MSKPVELLPFTRDEVEIELREILYVQATQIAHAGSDEAAIAFLGFNADFSPAKTYDEKDVARVDLSRFNARSILATAFDYAFQTGSFWRFGEDNALDISTFREGVTPAASSGERSPFHDDDSKCRHVCDMALGRWNLDGDTPVDLDIRQLALLARMTEAAVRNSLSVEQIKTRGRPAQVPADVARTWLMGRRGFVPTRLDENREGLWALHSRQLLSAERFPDGLRTLLSEMKITPEQLAHQANVELALVTQLLGGAFPFDAMEALKAIGATLKVDVPYFVGQAVEATLRR